MKAALETIGVIAREAGHIIMPYFEAAHNARFKEDKTPVTDADMAAHHYITEKLKASFDYPAVSEEDEHYSDLARSPFYFLVDPLDGTRSFIRGEENFTVNIALMEKHKPVVGAVYVPVLKTLYIGGVGLGAFKEKDGEARQSISARAIPKAGPTVLVSSSHSTPKTEAYLASLKAAAIIPRASSIKFCNIAEGSADIYPRMGRTMEWDTAAGQAVLEAAGGRVENTDGTPLTYGKPGFENPDFISWGA